MTNASAHADQLDLTTTASPPPPDTGAMPPALVEPAPIAIAPTGDPIMDMAQRASANGDVATLKELLAIRDAEMANRARAAFNGAFAKMQAEMPIIPKRGRGHNGIQYARIEDIFQHAMPVLARHGLSLRHKVDTSEGVAVTAILAHVDGHSEANTFTAAADGSGNKNSIQALASAVTYGKRYTAEALLGLTSHGEDDDAFAADDTPKVADYRAMIGEAETLARMEEISGIIVRDTEMSGRERTAVGKIWSTANKTLKGKPNA